MNFNNLNLNISNYSKSELFHLFSIKHDEEINDIKNLIEKSKKSLFKQINDQIGLKTPQKNELHNFIELASNKVIEEIKYLEINKKNEGTWSQVQNPITEVGSHIIINNPNLEVGKRASVSDGRIAGTDAAPPGWLNPINIKTLKTGINIDSRFRDNYYGSSPSQFSIELPVQQHKVINIRVATIDIPMSYYIIDRSRGDATCLIVKNDKDLTYDPNDYTYLDLTNPSKPQEVSFEDAKNICSWKTLKHGY